jgi:general secretion pathway protein I
MPPRDVNGFSLIEVLVALAVFSLAAMALLNLAGENTRAATAIETRALASVVAENRAVEAVTAPAPPPLGLTQGQEAAGGRSWRWTRLVSPTTDPEVLKVDIAVLDGTRTAAELTVFRGAQ